MDGLVTTKRSSDNQPQSPRKRRRTRFSTVPSVVKNQKEDHDEHVSVEAVALDASNSILPRNGTSSSSIDIADIPVAPVSTLKINQQVARRQKIKRDLKLVEADLLETDPSRNAYFDPDIKLDASTRRASRATFSFVDPTAIATKAEKERERAERRAADAHFIQVMARKAAEVGSLPPLPPLAEGAFEVLRGEGSVPQVEWWDAPFIGIDSITRLAALGVFESDSSVSGEGLLNMMDIREDKITHYVHHPVPIVPTKPEKPIPVMPLLLTEKERKRLRKQKRLERETERREMVAVGLLPPPPPKVKLSNLMRVLANEASADPTRVEAEVRAQVEERQRKHVVDNEARRKTKPELREKAELRSKADRENGLFACVFRVLSMENAQHIFKVDINARQLELTGTLVLYPYCNMIVVEGGVKALRRYKALMLRRIDWTSSSAKGSIMETSDAVIHARNKCALVWEGPIVTAAFDAFKIVKLPTENGVRSFLKKRQVESYFDLAAAYCWERA